MNSYFFKITDEEKTNILSKHRELYDGYVSMQKKQSPQQLSVYDDISDKNGLTLKSSDIIKEVKENMCEQCGTKMNEKECPECGAMNENWDTEDLNLDNSMDFIESEEYKYELNVDDNKEYSPTMESFIRIASEMNLIYETPTVNKKVNKTIKSNRLNEELDSIKSFMIKINAY
jgi:hypothetical protein